MEENLVRIFLENDPHLTLHYYMIKLCLTDSYDVLPILMLMLLFSKIIPHPERMELPHTRKLYQIGKVCHTCKIKGIFCPGRVTHLVGALSEHQKDQGFYYQSRHVPVL